MPASEFERWRHYWSAEPWGPWRDNVHAAIIAAETARPHRKKPAEVSYENFMLIDREQHDKKKTAQFVANLKAMAKPKAKT